MNKKIVFSVICLLMQMSLFAKIYPIGPGKTYESIGAAPLSSLSEGDSVIIYYRNEPYHEKWVITGQGSKAKPVVFHGVANESGQSPVIDGQNALTPPGMNFWSEGRGVIKIGGANNPPDIMPSNIIIENLDIKNGSTPFTFTGRNGVTQWDANAAAIFVEKGENITIRNCIMHNCGNGFFSAHESKYITVEYCYIYGNGNVNSIYEHNNYTESFGITFQFNRFGPLREGAQGNNLKDRSAGCVIRYNWIESGNRQLDLVDSDYDEFIGSPSYNTTFVYGNILIEPDGAGNSQIIHYGGDSGEKDRYRKGVLYLYNNTIVSTRSGNTTLLRLSSPGETADVRNNIMYVSATGSHLGIVDDEGTAELRNNWMKSGWRVSHSNASASVTEQGKTSSSDNPGFTDLNDLNFNLLAGSPCINSGIVLADACLKDNQVNYEYQKHQKSKLRIQKEGMDLGAFEYADLSGVKRKCIINGSVADFKGDKKFVLVNNSRSVKYDESIFFLNGRALQLIVPRNGAVVVLGR